MLLIPLVLSQAKNLSLLNTGAIQNNVLVLTDQVTKFLAKYGIDGDELLREAKESSKASFAFIPNFFNNLLGSITDFGVGFASVMFITFFFLKAKKLLSRYFIGLLIQLSIVTTLYLIILLIFGVRNAFVIAFLGGLLNIVPYIGPLIATISAGVLTMLSNLGQDFQTQTLPVTIYVLIGFWIVQILDNNFSQPLIFSKSVSSHPLEIFLVILISGYTFGILGMIIAIPSYTALKVFAKEFFPENKIVQSLTKKI
jgi:predicted PurR-regulated permease PerM